MKPVGFLPLGTSGFRQFSRIATTYNSTSVPNKSAGIVNPTSEQSNPVVDDEATGNACEEDTNSTDEGTDDLYMVRVCDKLIDVFLVEKSSPTDWRKLLAYSREWDSIRPHFYNRCQVRADNEDDPEKKHRLLRLARKLKEVFHISHFFLYLVEGVNSVVLVEGYSDSLMTLRKWHSI